MDDAVPTARELTRQWFRDAKFGLFVHWAVYALLGKGEWIRTTGKIPRAEYAKLQHRFNPKRFSPDAWAEQMLVCTRSTGGPFRTRCVGHVNLANGANALKLVLCRLRRQQSLDLRRVSLKPVSP